MSTVRETVGQRIKRFREERGLTASELAEKAGVAKSYLSTLEHDEVGTNARRPSADTLYRIAKVLGVAMSDLLGKPVITAAQNRRRPASLVKFARSRNLPEADI
jgi:XRE family transcriptional regulator of biofilm formation